jgi:hypothetical protein
MILTIVVGLLSIGFFMYNADGNFWHPKALIVKLFALLLVCSQLFPVLPLITIFAAYAIGGAIYLTGHEMLTHFCQNPGEKNHQWRTVVTAHLLDTYAFLLILLFIPIDFVKMFFDSLPLVALVGTYFSFKPINISIKRLNGKTGLVYGIGGNTSINSTAMSIVSIGCLAGSNQYLAIAGWLIAGLGCIKTKGSTGIIALLIGSLIYWAYIFPLYILGMLGIIIITLPLWWNWSKKFFTPGRTIDLFGMRLHPIFYSSGRNVLWPFAWKELWLKYCNKFWGCGMGTVSYAMPALQIHLKEEMFLQHKEVLTALHSDLYQWWIEGGLIGTLLLIGAIAEVIMIGYRDPYMMAMLGCFFVNSMANYPAKLSPDSFIFILSLKRMIS